MPVDLTPPPDPAPSRGQDNATFSRQVAAFVAWCKVHVNEMVTFVSEMNTLGADAETARTQAQAARDDAVGANNAIAAPAVVHLHSHYFTTFTNAAPATDTFSETAPFDGVMTVEVFLRNPAPLPDATRTLSYSLDIDGFVDSRNRVHTASHMFYQKAVTSQQVLNFDYVFTRPAEATSNQTFLYADVKITFTKT